MRKLACNRQIKLIIYDVPVEFRQQLLVSKEDVYFAA